MKTVRQVTTLTGISARTLQYYDEIGLLKPSGLTTAGYRLYNDEAIQRLQQILFFKELGFHLKEINDFLSHPDFDKISAYKKQKELLLLKRNRTDKLIQLLSHLEKGEQCMSFKEFDLSEYIDALERFKKTSVDSILKHWGNIDNFDLFIQKIKEEESELAKLAIKQFGSVEKYTEAMKYNMEHFTELMDVQQSEDTKKITQQSDDLYTTLTSDMKRDVSTDEVQHIVKKIELLMQENTNTKSSKNDYWNMLISTYSKDLTKKITDTKYGAGASAYIVQAFQYYANTNGG